MNADHENVTEQACVGVYLPVYMAVCHIVVIGDINCINLCLCVQVSEIQGMCEGSFSHYSSNGFFTVKNLILDQSFKLCSQKHFKSMYV